MLNQNFGDGNIRHECESYSDGEWIIFRCPLCEDYERRVNPRTGENVVTNMRAEIHHSGSHISARLKAALDNTN